MLASLCWQIINYSLVFSAWLSPKEKTSPFFSFLNFTAINLLNLHALPIFGGGKRRARAAQRRKNEGTFCALFSKPPKTSLADRGNSKLCKELSTLRAFKLLRGRLRRTKSRQFVDERWWCFYSTITSARSLCENEKSDSRYGWRESFCRKAPSRRDLRFSAQHAIRLVFAPSVVSVSYPKLGHKYHRHFLLSC